MIRNSSCGSSHGQSLEQVKMTKVPHSVVKARAFSEGTASASREGSVGRSCISKQRLAPQELHPGGEVVGGA
eukprot:Skav200531  [mRNA]  locus=scaffold3153:14526:19236:+ [translate_table: standard]